MEGEKLKMVFLKWCDCVGDSEHGWKDPEQTDDFFERRDNIVCEAGFIWDEDADPDFLYLCGKYMPGEFTLTAHRTMIPKKWILEMREIEYNF